MPHMRLHRETGRSAVRVHACARRTRTAVQDGRSDLLADTLMIESGEADLRSDCGSSDGRAKRRGHGERGQSASGVQAGGLCAAGWNARPGPGCGGQEGAQRGALGRETGRCMRVWICVIEIRGLTRYVHVRVVVAAGTVVAALRGRVGTTGTTAGTGAGRRGTGGGTQDRLW